MHALQVPSLCEVRNEGQSLCLREGLSLNLAWSVICWKTCHKLRLFLCTRVLIHNQGSPRAAESVVYHKCVVTMHPKCIWVHGTTFVKIRAWVKTIVNYTQRPEVIFCLLCLVQEHEYEHPNPETPTCEERSKERKFHVDVMPTWICKGCKEMPGE